MRLVAVVPAAGQSSRFPGNKLSHVYKGKPILTRTIETILLSGEVDRVIVVLGNDFDRLVRLTILFINDRFLDRVIFAYNPEYWITGMSQSIKIGVKHVSADEHIMIHPADVALVSPHTIKNTVLRHANSLKPVTVACYRQLPGHPIIFRNDLKTRIMEINEETLGLKGLLKPLYDKKEVECVETNDVNVLRDIDELDDLHTPGNFIYARKLERKLSSRNEANPSSSQ